MRLNGDRMKTSFPVGTAVDKAPVKRHSRFFSPLSGPSFFFAALSLSSFSWNFNQHEIPPVTIRIIYSIYGIISSIFNTTGLEFF